MKRWDYNSNQIKTQQLFKKWLIFPMLLLCLLFFESSILSAQTSPFKFHSKIGFKSQVQNPDPWFGKDKFDHFVVSAFLTAFTYYSAREYFQQSHTAALNMAGGITFALGVGKEIRDKKSKKGMASFRDLAADILGVGIGLLICRVSS